MLPEHVIEEIKAIPTEKLVDVYKFIQQFRSNLSDPQTKNHKTVDEVFGKLHRNGRKRVSVEEMDAAIKARMQFQLKLKLLTLMS
jgi:hypothetical protein